MYCIFTEHLKCIVTMFYWEYIYGTLTDDCIVCILSHHISMRYILYVIVFYVYCHIASVRDLLCIPKRDIGRHMKASCCLGTYNNVFQVEICQTQSSIGNHRPIIIGQQIYDNFSKFWYSKEKMLESSFLVFCKWSTNIICHINWSIAVICNGWFV